MPPKREHRSAEIALLREELAAERARCDALIREVLALKRDGFVATVQYDTPPAGPSLPRPVLAAIAERSEPGTVERRELERYAADMVRAGTEPEMIADRIAAGEDVDL